MAYGGAHRRPLVVARRVSRHPIHSRLAAVDRTAQWRCSSSSRRSMSGVPPLCCRAARGAPVSGPYPYARAGLARVQVARGDYERALASYEALMADVPTPEWSVWIGDLHTATGNTRAAEAAYVRAYDLERAGWEAKEPQYAALARFLAERNRDIDEAVQLAERGAASRLDVPTLDALGLGVLPRRPSRDGTCGGRDRDLRRHPRSTCVVSRGGDPTCDRGRGRCAPVGRPCARRPRQVRPGELPGSGRAPRRAYRRRLSAVRQSILAVRFIG